jgi:predicted Rossmann fold nucleotide-binding protein DprA/Smf involved in DNA uptake
MAEEAFTSELARLVSHLTERISGQDDGKPKIFRDSVIENLREFFQRFKSLNVASSTELDRLVETLEGPSASEVIAILFELEFSGLVRQIAGKNFLRIWND